MATIGILRTNAVDGGTYFYVDWKRTSYSIADNTSTVDWALYIRTVHNYYSNAVRNYGVSINGVQVFGGGVWSNIYSNTNTQLASGTITIAHNNDGTKTFNINTSGWVYENYDMSGSENFTLNSIPRQANLTNAENFTDEGNPTITYSNPAGNSVTTLQACISLSNSSSATPLISYRDISKTGTSYTFSLTSAERTSLRNATTTSNSKTVYFFVKTVIGSNTFYSGPIQRTMTIINANPTFSNFTYEDTNTTTTALTGDNQICVLGYSNIKAIISSANKATANKGASMSKYQFVIGSNIPKYIEYSSSSEVSETINNVTSGTMIVYAIDSRGNSTPVQKTSSTIKNYSNIYLNANNSSVERNDSGVGGQGTLHYEGTFWNSSFGSVTNTIKSISYEYKKTTDSTYTTGATDITPTVSGNNISFTGVIKGPNSDYTFDVDSSYNVRVTISDELSSYTINLILNSGTPNIAYADDGVAIMGDYDDNLGSGLQVYGDIYINKKKIGLNKLNVANSWINRKWMHLCNIKFSQHRQGELIYFKILGGIGNNGSIEQNFSIDLYGQLGWTGSVGGRLGCNAIINALRTSARTSSVSIKLISNSNIDYELWIRIDADYCMPNYTFVASDNVNVEKVFTLSDTEPVGTECNIEVVNSNYYNKYDTNEIIIGTWIDGKPLYRKVYKVENKENSYGIAKPSNVDTFAKLSVIQKDNNNAWIPSYYWTSSDYLRIFTTGDYIQIRTSKANNTFIHYIIIEYTKTTD